MIKTAMTLEEATREDFLGMPEVSVNKTNGVKSVKVLYSRIKENGEREGSYKYFILK